MPKLIIDNREVTVPEGTNVLEAARALDIVIPHFCYHEALGAVGACRLCAMKFLEGPLKGLQMACMIKAQDGMVVSTTDADAAELRAHVIEWLMASHPHDCPVCDEGGECQLQDMTIAGGHGTRRYSGPKRTFDNQELGPFVEQEMNRCIACYRCVRTYRDYCGGTDFGVFGSRNRLFFGRVSAGRLESPFSGNLVDVCPTGVFTDKTYRFKSRCWDLQEAPSICPHCSLGCATVPGARLRELQRVRAGINAETNGFFICDRGRFGAGYVNHTERPRRPKVDGQAVTMDAALSAVQQRLGALVARHGAASVALLGSSRASLEANALLAGWGRELGTPWRLFEAHSGRDRAARSLASGLGSHARSLKDVRQSDLVVLVGADPAAEGPLLGLALRQAVRAGGRVVSVDPRPLELPCKSTHLPLAPERLPQLLAALGRGDLEAFSRHERSLLDGLLVQLGKAQRPILVGGGDLLGEHGINALLAAAAALGSSERPVGVVALLAGPNSYGGALLAEGDDFDALLDAVQAGEVKALVCLESDPFREAQDPARAQAALGHLELLVALDCTSTLAVRRADIVLPTRAPVEMAGAFVNNEGRLQAFLPVLEPGLPVRETGGGDHPPRSFELATPGAEPWPAWQLLAALGEKPQELGALRRALAAADPRLTALAELQAESLGVRLTGEARRAKPAEAALTHGAASGTLPLLVVSSWIGSDWLAHHSAALAPLRDEPLIWLHPEQAAALSLDDGDRVRLTTTLGHCQTGVRVSADMQPGLVLAPFLCDGPLDGLLPGSGYHDCTLAKEGEA